MGKNLDQIIEKMRASPKGVQFSDLVKICDSYFGKPRQNATSHRVYKIPWSGDPRVNIQNDKGKAKVYQVKQVLAAIDKLEEVKNAR